MNGLTLRLGPVATDSCSDPGIWGESVTTVDGYRDANNATIAVASRNPQTGAVTDGPVVMTYGTYSDTRPLTTYGGGWLWIYDVDTTKGAEVLQVSASTGQVDDTIPMPRIYRPILAATDHGLWIGTSVEGIGGSGPGYGPPSALYFVSPGSETPVTVVPETTVPVCWLATDDDSLWAGMGSAVDDPCGNQTIWHFVGSDLQPVGRTALQGDALPADGLGQSSVVGDVSDGLWTATFVRAADVVEVMRIDPDSGMETVVATVPVPTRAGGWTAFTSPLGEGIEAVVVGGSLYLLEPSLSIQGFDGAIVRVTPNS